MNFPNPIAVAQDAGPPADGEVPGWDEATGTFQFITPGAGGFPTDIGWLSHYVIGPGETTVAQAQVTPPPNQGPTGQSAHVPSAATAVGLVTLAAAGAIQVQCDGTQITEGLWDFVDGYGYVQVVNPAGTEVLIAALNLISFDGPGSAQTFGLSEVSSVGSDLAITGDNSIASTAGGLFTVILQAQAEWD